MPVCLKNAPAREQREQERESEAIDVGRVPCVDGGRKEGKESTDVRALCALCSERQQKTLRAVGVARTLLLLNHANRVDKGRREDRRAGGRGKAGLALAHEKAIAKEEAKLGHALEQHANHARPEAGERRRDGRLEEDGVRLRRRDLRVDRHAVEVLRVLLHELAVRGHRVVANRLDGGAAEVGAHVLGGREAVLADLVVRIIEEEGHGAARGQRLAGGVG